MIKKLFRYGKPVVLSLLLLGTMFGCKKATTPPPPPMSDATSFQAKEGDASIELRWVNPNDQNLKSATLTVTYEENGEVKNVAGTPITRNVLPNATETYLVKNLTNGTEYTCKIVNTSKQGVKSKGVTRKVTPVAGAITLQITLDPAEATNQNVTIKVTCGKPLSVIKWIKGKVDKETVATSGTDLAAGSNNEYSFEIIENGDYTIYGKTASGAEDIRRIEITNIDKKAPGEVSNLKVEEKSKALDITWVNPTDEDFDYVKLTISANGSAISGYDNKDIRNSTKESVTNLTDGTEYTITIVTVDKVGNISKGTTIKGTPTSGKITSALLLKGIKFTSVAGVEQYSGDVEIIVHGSNLNTLVSASKDQIKINGVDVPEDNITAKSTTLLLKANLKDKPLQKTSAEQDGIKVTVGTQQAFAPLHNFILELSADQSICTLVGVTSETQQVKIPEGITHIKEKAFGYEWLYKKNTIKDITLPKSLVAIGKGAFKSQVGLENVIIPEGAKLETIDESAFENCQALKAFDLTHTQVKSIGQYAFKSCEKLENFTFVGTLETIGSQAFFGCKALTNADLTQTKVKVIENNTFKDCEMLTIVKFPATLTRIADGGGTVLTPTSGAFGNCLSLKEIDFSACVDLETIGSFAFYNAGSGAATINVKLDNATKLKTIGACAFRGFGEGVQYVFDLSKCVKLQEIGGSAFAYISTATIKLPDMYQNLMMRNANGDMVIDTDKKNKAIADSYTFGGLGGKKIQKVIVPTEQMKKLINEKYSGTIEVSK